MSLKIRLSRIIFFKLIQFIKFIKTPINKLKSTKIKSQRIYIIMPAGAGDMLMSLNSINFILKNCSQEIILLCCRNEVLKLAKLYFKKSKVFVYDDKTRFNNKDLVIVLSGPPQGLAYKLFISNCEFHGFVYDLKIRSSIVKSNRDDLIELNHIRRNNLIIEKLFKLSYQLEDIVLPPPIDAYLNKKFYSGKIKKIALYFPQEKKRKAFPYEKILNLFNKLSTQYEVYLIGFSMDSIDREFIERINNKYILWTDWEELLDILQNFDLIITIDSVVYHLCNSLNKKFIGLFGCTSHKAYKTYNSNCFHIDYSNPENPCYSGCLNSKRKGNRPLCNCNSRKSQSPCSIFNKIKEEDILSTLEIIKNT